MTFRILHIDDERDIRRLVELSLSCDPDLTVRSCASGAEAIAAAADWSPHLILCDVMMPSIDGPTTLARLRENPRTADIPVMFMTARVQARELDHFKSLGAIGVIEKPFSAKSLRASVRSYLQPDEAEPSPRQTQVAESGQARGHIQSLEVAAERDAFRKRLQTDVITLARLRATWRSNPTSLDELQTLAHRLAGAAGCFDLEKIGQAALVLEESVFQGDTASVETHMDALVECLEREQPRSDGGSAGVEPGWLGRAEESDPMNTAAASSRPTDIGGIEEPPTSQNSLRERPRILIVDDDPDIGHFLGNRLRKVGVEPLFATDGVQGYQIAQREKPDVIISDYFMPVGNINFLMWKLRSTPVTKNIPVVVMSGWRLDKSTEENLRKDVCGRQGAVAIFSKPVDIQALFATLRRLCRLTETATPTS